MSDLAFAYHATLKEFLGNIVREGLLPHEHPSSPEEPVLFVEREEREAMIYLEPDAVMLRFSVGGFGSTEDGEDILHDRILPEAISVREGGKWVPLLQYSL